MLLGRFTMTWNLLVIVPDGPGAVVSTGPSRVSRWMVTGALAANSCSVKVMVAPGWTWLSGDAVNDTKPTQAQAHDNGTMTAAANTAAPNPKRRNDIGNAPLSELPRILSSP